MTTAALAELQKSAPSSANIPAAELRRITSLPISLCLWREAQNDVKPGGQLANPRAFDRRKIDGHRFLLLCIANAAIDPILIISSEAFDVTLRRKFFHSLGFHHEMNMRAAAGIGDGLDGPEVVFAARSGHEAPESLEILVAFFLVGRAAVQIGAVIIHLPDFDEHVAQRFSVAVQYSTGQMSSFTDGRRA